MEEIASLQRRINALETELNQVKAKLESLVTAHKILTEVLMNMVAETNG